LHLSVTDADDAFAAAEIYDELPVAMRSCFSHAFNHIEFKYWGYEPLKERIKARVAEQKARMAVEGSAYCPPPFEEFFREHHSPYWDGTEYLKLRATYAAAFEAVVRVARGSSSGEDLCLFAALACCWEPQMRKRQTPEAWQPLLHLAQATGSPVHLTVEDLKLSDKATSQLKHDARKIRDLLGEPLGIEIPNVVAFSCRADYGDVVLSAQGTVHGRADVSFSGGPLEIKAVSMPLQAVHSAQALWYACATQSSHAWLWDVYRRRLLVYTAPREPALFLKPCILAYLKYNAPPDSAKRVWPQDVRIHALCG
jgi:hypothetical protein